LGDATDRPGPAGGVEAKSQRRTSAPLATEPDVSGPSPGRLDKPAGLLTPRTTSGAAPGKGWRPERSESRPQAPHPKDELIFPPDHSLGTAHPALLISGPLLDNITSRSILAALSQD
jgi:hypothetical protein